MEPQRLAAILADLIDLAAGHRHEGDALRHLPPDLAAAFLRHDIYRLILPPDLGGADLDPLDYLQLVEDVARVDGSIAWNLTIGIGSGLYGGYLPVARGRALFAGPDCCIAGAYAPTGKGVAVEGGYRINGQWGWASGADQARWMVFGFMVDPTGEIRQGLAPAADFRILDGWHVGGMRGTGSTDYAAEGLFVPADMTFKVFKEPPRHPAPLFRMPAVFFASAVAIVPVGIALGATEALKQLAAVKAGRAPLRDQAFAQYAVAKAEALAESGGLYLRHALAEVWQRVRAGEEVGLDLRVRSRRACVHAAESAAEAVDLCCRAAGGHALFQSQPFERALRDVRATLGHIVLQRGAMEDAGRVAFGLPPLFPAF